MTCDTALTNHCFSVHRSFVDAKETNYECSIYECQYAADILPYISNLEKRHMMECYYNPDHPDRAFLETGSWNQILALLVTFSIFTAFGIILDLVAVGYFIISKCRKHGYDSV